MLYSSTRGGSQASSFETTVLSGYCPDGGLFIPDRVPVIQVGELKGWAELGYVELAKRILGLFIDEREIPRGDLHDLLDKAFSRLTSPNKVELVRLGGGLNILELFHGPTLAFKDLALSCTAQFLNYFLKRNNKRCIVLVGTSGDTGSAAIEALKGLTNVDIIVLLPKDGCTAIQELQMTTVLSDNSHVYRVEGTSDDLDSPIRRCFEDKEFVERYNLCSVNSINWSRILVQIVHYFYAYLQMCPSCEDELEIVVPTGAAGNIAGGCIARKMGLPIKLVCTVNCNDVIHRLLSTGVYSVEGKLVKSLASAMDIQMAYNVERLLCLYSDNDKSLVNKLMKEFEENKATTLPAQLLDKIRVDVSSHVVNDESILRCIKKCFEESGGHMVCPHTATAVDYHYKNSNSSKPRVCVATASHEKFPEAMTSAGVEISASSSMRALFEKQTRYQDMKVGENWFEILTEKIVSLSKRSERLED